jgi:hypothetical protein
MIPCRNLPRGTAENYEKPAMIAVDLDLNLGLHEYEKGIQ